MKENKKNNKKEEIYRFSEFYDRFLGEKEINIRGMEERSSEEFNLKYTKGKLKIEGLRKRIQRDILYGEGVLPYEEGKTDRDSEIIKKMRAKYKSCKNRNKLPALGLDTNMIYSNIYLSKLKWDLKQYVRWTNPFILLTISSSEEIHYKSSSRYNRSRNALNNLIKKIEDEDEEKKELIKEVLKKPETTINKKMYGTLPDSEGRMGYLGLYKFAKHRLQPNTTVIKPGVSLVKIFKKIEGEKKIKNIDSVFDIQITNEFNLYAGYTNTEEIVLTMDKDLSVMLEESGINTIYMERYPSRKMPEEIKVNQREITKIIREILVYSPYIVIEGKKEIILSSCWFAESQESLTEGKIHGTIKKEGKIKHIWIVD